MSSLSMFIDNIFFTVIIFLITGTAIFILKLHSKFFDWIKFIIFVCVLIILIQSFTYSGLRFTTEGLLFGVITSLKLLTITSLVFAFISTIPLEQLSKMFDFLPKEMSMMLTLTLRLLFIMKEQILTIVQAQKARGLNFNTLNVFKVYFPIFVPLFNKILENSQRMALSIESRGMKIN